MNAEEAKRVVVAALTDVAPEIDEGSIQPDVPFQEQFDLDSMDILNYVTGLEESAGKQIPERDYPQVASLSLATAYLVEHAVASGAVTT